jgi:hypothetical protein
MNWEDIGKTLLGLGLPTLGTALGGPLGGAAGKMIADALGTAATPAAVGAALSTDPVVQQKLAETEAEWARTAAAIANASTAQSAGINATMQAELASGVSWWHWRHLLGYVVGGWILGIAVAFTRLMWVADAGQITNVTGLLNSGFAYFGAACGLLGYVAMDTSRRSTAAASGSEIPTLFGGIIKAVTRK